MFHSRSLSSFINKTISNSLKNNIGVKNVFVNNKQFSSKSTILNTNYKNHNEISNEIKSILNNNTNNTNNTNNNYSYRKYSTNSSNNNKKNTNNEQLYEEHLIYNNTKPYLYKLGFVVPGIQVIFCLMILSEHFMETEENRSNWAAAGAVGLTLLTIAFVHHMGKKDVALIHTFNKGRVIQITSYTFNGFPVRKRTVTLDSIISSKANDKIGSPLYNQDKTFYFKIPGDRTYFNASLKDSKIIDPVQLERIIHASKQSISKKKK